MSQIKFIENARKRYKAIRSPVKCKCLNQAIYFNSDGFNHLQFNGLGKPRTIKEMKHKMRLIPLIVPVLQNATNASYETKKVKKNRKKNSPLVTAEFWGLEANVGKSTISVRVIVRRIGNGNMFFRSVMIGKNKKHHSP